MVNESKIQERYLQMLALVNALAEIQKYEEDYEELNSEEKSMIEDLIGLAEQLNVRAHEVCVKYSAQYRKVRGLKS